MGKVRINQAGISALNMPGGPVHRYVTKIVRETEAEAKRLVRVDTGFLKSRLDHEVTPLPNGVYGRVFDDAEYAASQEFGWRHNRNGRFIPGKAYLGPAFAAVLTRNGLRANVRVSRRG